MNRFNRPYLADREESASRIPGCNGCSGRGESESANERGYERGCGHGNPCADCLHLAIAAILPQPFENLLDPMEGWHRGTIFADLDKPYEGGCCR